uniref:Uncharacterized protein n=1 Tax=Daphnia galeata TaxID=27404 RepID=A0A8J2RQV8_9CRUS|nr:unnamed protein product [Daphnia galeata]
MAFLFLVKVGTSRLNHTGREENCERAFGVSLSQYSEQVAHQVAKLKSIHVQKYRVCEIKMAIDQQMGRSIVGKVIETAPSILFSAVVYGVPIVYTAGIVAEIVFTTFFKQTKRGRPSVSKALDKPEGNTTTRAQGGTCGAF